MYKIVSFGVLITFEVNLLYFSGTYHIIKKFSQLENASNSFVLTRLDDACADGRHPRAGAADLKLFEKKQETAQFQPLLVK